MSEAGPGRAIWSYFAAHVSQPEPTRHDGADRITLHAARHKL